MDEVKIVELFKKAFSEAIQQNRSGFNGSGSILGGANPSPSGIDTSGLVGSLIDLSNSVQNINKITDILNSAPNKLDQAVDDLKTRLEKVDINTKNLDKLKDYEKKRLDAEKNFLKEISELKIENPDLEDKIRVGSAFNGGRSNKFAGQGQSMMDLGKKMNAMGGKYEKAGASLTKWGGRLMKSANLLGNITQLLDAGVKAYTTYNKIQQRAAELEKEKIEIENRRLEAQNAITLKSMQLNNEVLQQTISYNNEMMAMQYQMKQQTSQFHANLSNEAAQISADGYVAANKMALTAPFDIKGAMYAAGNAAIDIASRSRMYDINKSYGQRDLDNSLAKIQASMDKTSSDFYTNLESTVGKTQNDIKTDIASMENEYEKSNIDWRLHEERNTVENWTDGTKAAGDVVSAGSAFLPGTGKVVGAATGGVMNKGADIYHDVRMSQIELKNAQNQVTKAQMDTELINQKQTNAVANMVIDTQTIERKGTAETLKIQKDGILDLNKIQIDREKKLAEIQAKAATDILHEYMGLAQKLNDTFLKMENHAFIMGRDMGLASKQLKDYSSSMANMQYELSPFGKNLEWMQDQQSRYQEATGRTINYSTKDFQTTAALGHWVGDDVVNQLDAGMQIFNKSVADSNTMFYQMYKQVTKIGLSGKKYSKDLINNLKLAEKYDFKNGVKSVMEMTKWAQNMRFNMGSLDGALDKIQNGGLEGVIEQAAGLQVLGGNFAMGSDPLAMGYEAFMDPEGLAKRFNSMIAGQGVFDSKTGEVTFGIGSQMIMNQMAKLTGQDIKDVKNQARARNIQGRIKDLLNGNFTDDQQMAIANKANFNTETQQWEIEGYDHKMHNISELTPENLSAIMPNEEDLGKNQLEVQQHMLTEMLGARSTQEYMKGKEEEMQGYLQKEMWGELAVKNKEMIDTIFTNFRETATEKMIPGIRNSLKAMNGAVTKFQQMFQQGNSAIDAQVEGIGNTAIHIAETLDNIAKEQGAEASKSKVGVGDIKKESTTIKNADDVAKAQAFLYGPNSSKTLSKKEYDFLKENDKYGKIDSFLSKGKNGEYYFNSTKMNGRNAYQYVNEDILKRANVQSKIYDLRQEVKADKAYDNYVNGKTHYQTYGTSAGAYTQVTKDSDIMNRDEWNDKVWNKQKAHDGLIAQNGTLTRIDSEDQVLAAKNGGPIDKLLSAQPRPMPYNSFVKETPYGMGGSSNDGKIEIQPIQININGSIRVDGGNGSVDITQQLTNNPEFIRSLSQIISMEVEKKVNGGRVIDPINRSIQY